MKTIINYIRLGFIALIITCCSSEEINNPDLSNDTIRIISNWPEKQGDILGEFSIPLGETFNGEVLYSPTIGVKCTWFLNETAYSEGSKMSFHPNEMGEWHIRVEVVYKNSNSFREANLVVTEAIIP